MPAQQNQQSSQDDFLAKKRLDVEKQAEAVQFLETSFGKTMVEWYNAEIKRLTEQLINDKDLDESLPQTNAVKGELRAYLLIVNKLKLTNAKGNAAQAVLAINEPEPEQTDGEE